MNDLVPRETVAKNGVRAIFGIGGSVVLTILTAIGGGLVPGLIVGGITAAAGFFMYRSADKTDKKPGATLLGIGGLIAVAGLASIPILGFMGGIASFMLWAGKIGMLIWGVVSGIKFIKGMKSRS